MRITNDKNATSHIVTLMAVLAVLLLAGCGTKSSDKNKDAVTPSPTEETVINGRA